MPQSFKKHRLAILALDGFVPFDFSIPYNIFTQTVLPDGSAPYEVLICAGQPSSVNREWHICAKQGLDELMRVDTVMIPGVDPPFPFTDEKVLAALRAAAHKGVRIASICTGVSVLAAAGLLDGLRATTHWSMTDALAKRYPRIEVEPDILFVDNGQFLTSAGLASGIDLCLHMIRKDFGAAVAQATAQFFVLPIERGGGQLQRLHRHAAADDNLTQLLYWLQENLHIEHSLQTIAQQAHMSLRTLNRKFKAQIGMTPMVWMTVARLKRAQALLESTALSVEQIATATGFASAAVFRERFRAHVGTTPTAWRKTYSISTSKRMLSHPC